VSDLYTLQKSVWRDSDFDVMGWHDASIHAVALSQDAFEILLDIDYIFRWVQPEFGRTDFSFWVAPCTMVFRNVYDIRLEADSGSVRPILTVGDLLRSDSRRPKNADHIGCETEWRWVFDCFNGEVSFWSVGFELYVRMAPLLTSAQVLTLDERGGYSFAQTAVEVPRP